MIGDAAAQHRLVVFGDPDCPYCAKYHEEIPEGRFPQPPRIAFHFKVFPNNGSPVTYRKAVSIVCSKSVELLEDSYAGKYIPPPMCGTSVVGETMGLVHRLNIVSTPTTVLPDGRVIYGFQDADTLLRLMAERKRYPVLASLPCIIKNLGIIND